MSKRELVLSAVLSALDSPNPETLCFHCGLPAKEAIAHTVIEGVMRSFCCAGCEAAALTIAGLGLSDYYRLREAAGTRPDTKPGEFAPYDDALFQATFVRELGEGVREASLLLEGVRCSACLWLIEETLKRLSGVHAIEVNYVTRRASLRWNADATPLSEILRRIAALGYRAHPYQAEKIDVLRRAEQRQWLWRLFVAGFGMMQVMMYALPVYVAGVGEMSAEYETLMRWASFVLTLPVVVYSAQPFFLGAWRGIKAKKMGMDLPVALGVAIAFIASTWATFAHRGEVYFDSLTMFVFLLLLGRYLEMLARNGAGRALAHLAQLAPNVAERLQNYPASREGALVPVAQLAVGDVILVKPGESIAADGCVLEGRSAVNEALLSGESMPVAKSAGAEVVGGSVNMESPLLVRVTRVGEAGTLASIVRLVEQAAAQRQPLADMADRYAQKFVWLILGVTIVAAAVWMAIDPARAPWIAVSLLVATCPCALSLATPVALTAATGTLARAGMVVTRGHTIEALARATDFVFDKTGTLTEGRLSVAKVQPCGDLSPSRCLAIADALESGSEHPVAEAIRVYARVAQPRLALQLDGESHIAVPGSGVEASIEGKRYRLGNFAYCAELCTDAAARLMSNDASATRSTRVWLSREGALLAYIDLNDRLKTDARELIDALRADGKKVHLLSGDGMGAVLSVAHELGIHSVRANATPAAKREYVTALQKRGAKVAMIGDGVNDAPVLAQADVSVAMGGGATLAQSQADAVLISAQPRDLQHAVALSRRALRVIHQNLSWAFAYNFAVIPLAAAGWVNPWLAGLGMSLSSLLVVLNALRLRSNAR